VSDLPSIRVCRIIARLNVGGPARHVTLLDAGLRERGFSTTLAFGDVAEGEASLEPLAYETGNPMVKIAGLGRRISPISDALAFTRLVHLVFRIRPDIIHTHTAKAGTLGRLAALVYNLSRPRQRRALVVHTFHGNVFSGYFGRVATAVISWIERGLATVTDRIVVIAEQQRSDIVESHRIARSEKVSVIPLGLDLRRLQSLKPGAESLREELGLSHDDIVFGFVGRFAPIKDLPTLLRAFALLTVRERRARLVLAGDGEVRPAIEHLVDELAISDRVRLAGWRHDLPRLYATFDAVVLSSLNEGTPVALIEAMASGLPVVSTAAGGVVDLVEPGRTGWIVPVGDEAALAEAMCEASRSPDLRSRVGNAARLASGRYTHVRLIDDIERLYRFELQAKRQRGSLGNSAR
jgi:glycosyltransferase involved in cell wall biosynthesis